MCYLDNGNSAAVTTSTWRKAKCSARLGLAALLVLAPSVGRADPAPLVGLFDSEEAQHTLAVTLVGESTWHTADYAPISWVLYRRWRMYDATHDDLDFAAYIRAYSAVWKTDSARTKAIRALPWGEAGGKWGGTRWGRVRDFVVAFSQGNVLDPCPRALHFGGTMDTPHTRWKPVQCGKTANIFYTVPGFRDGEG